MVVDLAQVIELAGFAAAITVAMFVTGITYFEDRIPACMEKVDAWLKDIQEDLGTEITLWSETKKHEKGYEQILSVASEFSAVKSMNEQLDFMELRNSRQVKLNLIILAAIAGAVLAFYYANDQIPNSTAYDQAMLSAGIVSLLAGFLWVAGLFAFYNLYSDYSKLKRLVRQRALEPVEET